MVFKEPGKAQKKTPQGHQDLAFQKEQPGKGQEEIPLEEGSRKLKPLEYPPQQAITEKKFTNSGKGQKEPYSFLEEKDQSPERKSTESHFNTFIVAIV